MAQPDCTCSYYVAVCVTQFIVCVCVRVLHVCLCPGAIRTGPKQALGPVITFLPGTWDGACTHQLRRYWGTPSTLAQLWRLGHCVTGTFDVTLSWCWIQDSIGMIPVLDPDIPLGLGLGLGLGTTMFPGVGSGIVICLV